MTAAPGGLGAAERQMAVAQQFLRGSAVARIDRRADTDLDAMLAFARQQRAAEGQSDPLGELIHRFGGLGVGNGDREFIAAQPGDDPGGSDLGLQPLGDGTQNKVAAGMAKQVVDLLEAIEADHQQRNLAGFGFRHRNHRAQTGLQGASVGETGQRIVFRQISDAFGLTFAQRDVAQYSAILHAVGALPSGEAGLDRKHLAGLPAALEFDHGAARPRRHRRRRVER